MPNAPRLLSQPHPGQIWRQDHSRHLVQITHVGAGGRAGRITFMRLPARRRYKVNTADFLSEYHFVDEGEL